MKLTDKKIDRFILDVTPETKQRLAELEESVINDMKKLNNGEYAENFGLSEMTEQAEVTRWQTSGSL